MKFYLLSLLFILVGCGNEDLCKSDTYKTSGLIICDNHLDVNPDELDMAVDILEDELQNLYPNITNIENKFNNKKVKVIFTEENLATECREVDSEVYACEHFASGVNVNHNKIYVHYFDCLGFTSFAHELLHSIEAFYLDVKNGKDHDTLYFFEIGTDPYQNSIEYKVDSILREELDRCPHPN